MIDSFDRLKLANAAPRGSEPPESVLTLEALLVDIEERAGFMPIDTQVPEVAPRDPKTTRRGWLTAAVAFGVVLLFGAITALMMNQDRGIAPVDDVTVTTVALTAEQQVAYDTALRAIDVFNTGDIDAWMDLFRADGAFWGLQMSGTHVRDFIAFRMALGETATVDTCAPRIDPNTGREAIECFIVTVDDLTGRAGLTYSGSWIIQSDEKGRILNFSHTGREDPGQFIREMGLWVRKAYPMLFEETFAADGGCRLNTRGSNEPNCYAGEWHGTPETANELLRLVDEFIAQSDEYSLAG